MTDPIVRQKKNKKIIQKLLEEKIVQEAVTKNFILSIPKVINTITKGFLWFILTFLKPFWFSSSKCKKGIVAPYVYTTINMICFYVSIYIFLRLSWQTAIVGINNPGIVLPTLSGVIGILIVLNHSMISLYNKGKVLKPVNGNVDSNPIVEDDNKPQGVQ